MRRLTTINHDLLFQLLDYFREPRKGYRLTQVPPFDHYPPQEVRRMLYALRTTGLIQRIRGRNCASIWLITPLGRQCLAARQARS
jgi:hypothetical protein